MVKPGRREKSDRKWVGLNHDKIEAAKASNGGVMPYTPSLETTEFEHQQEWSEENLPEILFYIVPPVSRFANKKVELLYKKGKLVINPETDKPLRNFEILPNNISLDVPGWLVEAWRRIDPRIGYNDILDRQTSDPVLGLQKLSKNALQNHCRRECRKLLNIWVEYGRRPEPHRTEVDTIENLTSMNIILNTTLNFHFDLNRLVKVKLERKRENGLLYRVPMEVTQENFLETTLPAEHFVIGGKLGEFTESMYAAWRMSDLLNERALCHGEGHWSKLDRQCLPITWYDRTDVKSVANDTYDGGCFICTWTPGRPIPGRKLLKPERAAATAGESAAAIAEYRLKRPSNADFSASHTGLSTPVKKRKRQESSENQENDSSPDPSAVASSKLVGSPCLQERRTPQTPIEYCWQETFRCKDGSGCIYDQDGSEILDYVVASEQTPSRSTRDAESTDLSIMDSDEITPSIADITRRLRPGISVLSPNTLAGGLIQITSSIRKKLFAPELSGRKANNVTTSSSNGHHFQDNAFAGLGAWTDTARANAATSGDVVEAELFLGNISTLSNADMDFMPDASASDLPGNQQADEAARTFLTSAASFTSDAFTQPEPESVFDETLRPTNANSFNTNATSMSHHPDDSGTSSGWSIYQPFDERNPFPYGLPLAGVDQLSLYPSPPQTAPFQIPVEYFSSPRACKASNHKGSISPASNASSKKMTASPLTHEVDNVGNSQASMDFGLAINGEDAESVPVTEDSNPFAY